MLLTKNTCKKASLTLFAVFLLFSCSKDADLLSEYVIADKTDLESIALLVDDSFFISNGQPSILLDVLNNDTFESGTQVKIVSTSLPKNGSVVINDNNTLTYTPQTSTPIPVETTPVETTPVETTPVETTPVETTPVETTPVEDTFTYTTEVTSNESEVLRQEATVTISTAEMGELLAFPGAEGFGKYTTGGRGGKVIHVTNLNDSGSGSLRAALEEKGTRTVVFDVGGDIYLTGMQLLISSTQGNLTIAGETAPFPGITIRGDNIASSSYGGTLDIAASNVIIRYISVRENNNKRTKNDAIRLRNDSGMSNIILDHLSMSHGSDENLSSKGVRNATIQNCMISNGLSVGTFLFGAENYDFSFIGNYLSHTGFRNIILGYGKDGENIEFINNVTYGYEEGMFMTYGHDADIIGNIYKAFSNNSPNYASIQWNPNDYNNPNGLITDGSFYLADNYQLNTHQYNIYNDRALNYQSTTRVIGNSKISSWAKTAQGIEAKVFGNKLPGNSLHQDKIDEQAISDYYDNLGSFGSLSVPKKESTSRPDNYDTDKDGMADEWEKALFGDLSKTATGDEDGDGYTNIEAFLYSLVN